MGSAETVDLGRVTGRAMGGAEVRAEGMGC